MNAGQCLIFDASEQEAEEREAFVFGFLIVRRGCCEMYTQRDGSTCVSQVIPLCCRATFITLRDSDEPASWICPRIICRTVA